MNIARLKAVLLAAGVSTFGVPAVAQACVDSVVFVSPTGNAVTPAVAMANKISVHIGVYSSPTNQVGHVGHLAVATGYPGGSNLYFLRYTTGEWVRNNPAKAVTICASSGNDTIYIRRTAATLSSPWSFTLDPVSYGADAGFGATFVIYARAGNDRIEGGSGADIIYGEDGDDDIYGWQGEDSVNGGAGADDVRGGDGDDQVHGNDGNDQLVGDAGFDMGSGGAGENFVYEIEYYHDT